MAEDKIAESMQKAQAIWADAMIDGKIEELRQLIKTLEKRIADLEAQNSTA
jgi:hypothetical protein